MPLALGLSLALPLTGRVAADTTPGGVLDGWLLEDGVSGWLLEDGTSYWLMEGA